MRLRTTVLAAISTSALVLLLITLAIDGWWPFDTASSNAGAGRHIVWEGRVALQNHSLYALDTLPIVAEQECPSCLQIQTDAHGSPSLRAGNGIQGWPDTQAPSYTDCIRLRNKLTLDSVALVAARTSLHAVALHGWICATGGGNDGLLRLQYNGHQAGRYLFFVTSWGRPAEG